MVPTPAGYALVGPARRIMRECDQSTEVFVGSSRGVAGGLEIAALSTAVSGPFAQLVASWLTARPGAVLHVHDLVREDDVADALSSGSVEIVCTRMPIATSLDDPYRVISLGRGDLFVAVPPTSAAPPDRVLDYQDLAAVPMILVPPGRRSEFERMTVQRPLPVAAVVEQREARTAFMFEGIGGTLVGGGLVGEVLERGAHVRRLEPRFRQELGLVFADGQLSPVARSFIDAAVEYVGRRS
ncbi:LysR substrate-binding domain-containing protein [Rhodococcus koreensis]